ncbi:MAG: hypothetical protein GSR78_00360 [Desulfurococcales archaeon]|nr:hypothetical protein [Desulfurococcales archaeon]
MRAIDRIRAALFIVVSTPLKPGALHRLVADTMFEVRLAEAAVTARYIGEAFERGSLLGRGKIDYRRLGLGRLFGDALRDLLDFTGERPIPGLVYSSLIAGVVAGYSSEAGGRPSEVAKKLSAHAVYGSDPEDAVALVEGLEAIGASDLVWALENEGLTKRAIRLQSYTIGDVTERLSARDTGFLFNATGYRLLQAALREALASSSMVEATARAFYRLGVETGRIPEMPAGTSLARYLYELDKKRRDRESNNPLLGGTLLAVAIASVEKGLPPLAGKS